jgi:hypothetical protein
MEPTHEQKTKTRKIRWSSLNLRKYFHPDKIVGTSAFIISLGTFLTLTYQTTISQEQAELNRLQFRIAQEQAELNRKALYASMLPNLKLYNTQSPQKYELILENTGVGPAFVENIRVHYKGKTYEGDQHSFLTEAVLPWQKLAYSYSNLSKGDVIPAGHQRSLVSSYDPYTNKSPNADKLTELFGNEEAIIEITYSSVYEETWKINGMTPPQKMN